MLYKDSRFFSTVCVLFLRSRLGGFQRIVEFCLFNMEDCGTLDALGLLLGLLLGPVCLVPACLWALSLGAEIHVGHEPFSLLWSAAVTVHRTPAWKIPVTIQTHSVALRNS